MRSFLLALFMLPTLLCAAAATAAEPASPPSPAASCPLDEDGVPACPEVKLELGARTGVALPLGSVASSAQLNDGVAAQIPIILDVGFRPDPHLFVGAYGQYGLVFPASGQCEGASCSGSDVRVGLEALYHFRPTRRFDPWVGVGVGYEWLHTSTSRDGVDSDLTLRGFELVNLQAGLDYKVCTGLRVGPYASFSLGEYEKASATWTSRGLVHEQSTDIPNTALHEWVTLGVRGSFDL